MCVCLIQPGWPDYFSCVGFVYSVELSCVVSDTRPFQNSFSVAWALSGGHLSVRSLRKRCCVSSVYAL